MTRKTQYLTPADKKKIDDFLSHHRLCNQQVYSTPNGPLYHYTTGENFIKIIQSGEFWATQIACLNDTTELTYATEQILQRVKDKLLTRHNENIDPALKWIRKVLSAPGSEFSPVFVACFSEQRDDLSQWRAYSGGEGGYAIQFDSKELSKAELLPMEDGTIPSPISLVRVQYDTADHAIMFDDILEWTEKFFLELEGRKNSPTVEKWTEEFCFYWLTNLAAFAPLIKNPAFQDEREWRLIYQLGPNDPHLRPKNPRGLKFRQRQSMMSRHIPLHLKTLPVTGVLVGPCRHPCMSKAAVADLLSTSGFNTSAINIQSTEVPYRTV